MTDITNYPRSIQSVIDHLYVVRGAYLNNQDCWEEGDALAFAVLDRCLDELRNAQRIRGIDPDTGEVLQADAVSTVITITSYQVLQGEGVVERFAVITDGAIAADVSGKRWQVLTWLTEHGLDPEHAVALLDESLVGPVSTEVNA